MYEVIKKVIEAKRYDLSDILTKIDTIWIQGSITEEQRTQLVALARNNANMQNSVDFMAKLEELNKRVLSLEEEVATLKAGTGEGDTEEEIETTAPEYVAGKWYYAGNEVSFEGSEYICTAPEGTACVWSPAEYPAYWQIEVL